MVSDSQTTTTSDKPMESKVNEEAKLMEKEIVFPATEVVVKDKPVSDSNLMVTKEEQSDQTPAGEPEKESPAVVEAEESTKKEKDENGEELAEQVEIKEPTLVAEIDTEAVDEEKAEEKQIVESVVEEDNKDKEETKGVEVSESTDEAGSNQEEPVDVRLASEVPSETVEDNIKDVQILEKVETPLEKAKELAQGVEVVKAEETPESTEQAKVEIEGNMEKDTEEDVSSPLDVIEKAITEEKHILEEPSKNEQEKASEAKDVVTKLPTEDENITRDTETPAAQGKSEDTLKETDTETREKETEGNKQEESVADKVSEVVEVSDELKQAQAVTTKEVSVKQKHSNSIMSKVKQSLVKAKKAIIGKSPSSKTTTSEESKVK